MSAVAGRYARAFADVVGSMHLDAAQVNADVDTVLDAMQGSPALLSVWENPGIPLDQKIKVLDGMAKIIGLQSQTRNFLAVLIKQHRIQLLADVVKQFKTELNDRLGFAEAAVSSARTLSSEERSNLEKEVARMSGKSVSATYSTDATLIGGAVVTMGSTVYDGSVRGKLERLKKQMAAD